MKQLFNDSTLKKGFTFFLLKVGEGKKERKGRERLNKKSSLRLGTQTLTSKFTKL